MSSTTLTYSPPSEGEELVNNDYSSVLSAVFQAEQKVIGTRRKTDYSAREGAKLSLLSGVCLIPQVERSGRCMTEGREQGDEQIVRGLPRHTTM